MNEAANDHPWRSSAVAARWIGVRVVYRETTFWWTVGAYVKNVLMLFATVGLSLLWYEPKRFCDVILYRLDTGATLCRYEHTNSEDAIDHVSSLKDRLLGSQVFDFCRELGIPMVEIAGEGMEPPSSIDDIEVEWFQVPESRRYEEPLR
ncbi:hypothetical protein L615_014100000010 [Nocardioides sp. J9]|uniref:hypothetical protein n=1 Tax=Nocardioides sp. J9 TaxID=935844 RepID=UPI0011A1EF98|nr:hypothetical protein [Nocardioides sp. J9]TWH01913.1 hypothetical protein L615_014100000010 [Nocardioides sp. J9]